MKGSYSLLLVSAMAVLVCSLNVDRTHAQRMTLTRAIPNAYLQTNAPQSDDTSVTGHTSRFGSSKFTVASDPWRPELVATFDDGGASGSTSYAYGGQIYDAWNALTGVVGGQLKTMPGASVQSVQTQPTNLPYTSVEPTTGVTLLIDENGHVTYTRTDGTLLMEFDIFNNYLGEPSLSYETEDGWTVRASQDGYTLEIDPNGEDCYLSDGLETYALTLDDEGYLVYDDGDYALGLIQDEDGFLLADDSDGMFGVFDGETYQIYDEEDNLVEEGEIENPTLEERMEEEGIEDPFEALLDEDHTDEDAEANDSVGDDDEDGEDDSSIEDDAGSDESSGDGGSEDDAGSDDGSEDDGSSGEEESGEDDEG